MKSNYLLIISLLSSPLMQAIIKIIRQRFFHVSFENWRKYFYNYVTIKYLTNDGSRDANIVRGISDLCDNYNASECYLISNNHDENNESRYRLISQPCGYFYHENFIINITKYDKQTNNNERVHEEVTMTIYSKLPRKEIEQFCLDALNKYLAKMKKLESTNTPMYYNLLRVDIVPVYSRYKIETKTSFDNLFFPEKDNIIQLVQELENHNIKSLKILLHGIPGCGKTSIAKAISKMTGRHILNIKLDILKKDNDLTKVIFDNEIYYNVGLSTCMNVNIPMNKRIYLFEEIDITNKFALARKENDDEKETNEVSDFINLIKDTPKSGTMLQELLTTLDGIIEIDSAIIIMTTNHIEKLDPALIRPGRITMKLELKPIIREELLKMLHYHKIDTLNNRPIEDLEFKTDLSNAEIATFIQTHRNDLYKHICVEK